MGLEAYLTSVVFGYFVVVARIGSAMMFMPAFAEVQIPTRARLSFALVLCAAIYPATPVAMALPDSPVVAISMFATEATVGLWIGLSARVFLAAMQFAGYQVAQVSGLANAFGSSVGSFEGATLVATALLIGTVALIFLTNTHHIILRALMDSYTIFPLGRIVAGDLADQIVRVGAKSIYIGVAIAAPFFVMGVVLNLGMGLANRMMPQLPVFFVAASLLIAAGLIVFGVAIPSMIGFFIDQFSSWLMVFRL